MSVGASSGGLLAARGRRRVATYLIVSLLVLVSAAVVSLIDFPLRANLQNLLFDEYQRWRPHKERVEVPICVVHIDEDSIRRVGRWPWPRARLAELIRRIEAARPAALGLDILLSEPETETASAGDGALANAIAAGPVVLGQIATNAVRSQGVTNKASFAVAGDEPHGFVPHFKGLLPPFAALRQATSGLGFMNWLADHDRIVRRVPLVIEVAGNLYPSFAMELVRTAQGASTYIVKSSNASGEAAFGAKTGLVSIKNGDTVVPTDRQGAIRIDYSGDRVFQSLPAWQVLDPDRDLSEIGGKIVLVGVSAALLGDVVATPVRADESGVDIHAEVLAQLLTGDSLLRPDWAQGAEWLAGLVVSLGLAFALRRASVWLCALFGAAATSVFAVVSFWAFVDRGLLLDPIMPTFSSVAMFLACIFTLFGQKSRDEREMRSAFGRYVSPAVVARLAQNPEHLKLSGETRELTLMFCDLRSFTTLSEGMSADELRAFLNAYLTPMTDAVLATDGTVDKYMGDAIMAFWNAPLDDDDHARHAVQTALKMRALLAQLNANWRDEAARQGRGHDLVKFGVGLNTGACCVGNLGSSRRFDYSAIGDEVNVASRLEGSSKAFGVDIVASESTRMLTPEYAWLEIDQVILKNKTRPISVFALAGDPAFAQSEDFRRLEQVHALMLAAYGARAFEDAAQAAASARALAPAPLRGLYDYSAARFAALAAAPQPEDWRAGVKLEDK